MVRYSRVPPTRRARLRAPIRNASGLATLGPPTTPLTTPMTRYGFWSRLRGRGPFTVTPLAQLPEEQRSILIQALCEEIGCQLAQSLCTCSTNSSTAQMDENVDEVHQRQHFSGLPTENTSSSDNVIPQLDLQLIPDQKPEVQTMRSAMYSEWKLFLFLALVLLLSCVIGYLFQNDLITFKNFRIVNSQSGNITNDTVYLTHIT